MLEAVPTAIHRDDESLPYVFVDQGVELKVLQIKVREGLWVIRNRFQEPTEVWFAITGANLNLDADGRVEQVVDAGLVLQYYRMACEGAGLGTPNVIVD
jgi:hypothetical protein